VLSVANHLPARCFVTGPNRWKSLAANIARMGHNFLAVTNVKLRLAVRDTVSSTSLGP
jgi:hypothetical protein